MSVNRYDPEDWGGLHMVPKPDGDWVCYEAWEHVNRQIAALKEENERLKAEKVQINGKLAGSRLAVSRLEARVAERAAPAVQGKVGEGAPDARWLLDQYEAFIAAIPVGQENKTRGASAYNWHRAAKATLESLLDAAPAVQGEPVALPPFATKIIEKLRRFDVCAEDGQGVDIGRHWLDMLVQLGLLNRVQRSPAFWEMAQQGEDVLEGYTAPQHSPDVSELVEVLEQCITSMLDSGYRADAVVIRAARATIAKARGEK